MPRILINDGYNLPGKIDPVGPWPAVNIVYRPALPDRVQQYLDDAVKGRGPAAVKILAEHVLSWDVTDDKDKPVPVTEANLRRVPFPIREKMVDHVCGYAGAQAVADEKNSVTG